MRIVFYISDYCVHFRQICNGVSRVLSDVGIPCTQTVILAELIELKRLLSIAVVAMLIVLFAMIIDLVSGLYKAKLRGELRTSIGLRRTLMKFITYEGGMLIAVGVDMLLHLSRLMELFGLTAISDVPVVTCLVGIFLLVVEWLSVKEKADEKTKKNIDEAAALAAKLATREELMALLQQAITTRSMQDDAIAEVTE